VPDPSVMRLLRLQPTGPDAVVDADIRRALSGPLRALPGVRAVFAGRREPEEGGERVIVSVWPSLEAMADALDDGRHRDAAELPLIADARLAELRVMPLALAVEFERSEPSSILRVFSGQTRPGELAPYVEDARSGTYADVMAAHGPAALYLGIEPPDRFLTVSLWTSWDRIQAATGGNVRQPVATRHAHRLAGGSAIHYEILPHTAGELERVGVS